MDQQRHPFISVVVEKDFWSIPVAQGDLRNAIFRVLVNRDLTIPEDARHLADGLFDIVSHHRHALQRTR